MLDPRVRKLGQLLTNYGVRVQPGDRVLLRGSVVAMPLVKETYRAVLQAGGHPVFWLRDDAFQEILFTEGSDEQIGWTAPELSQIFENYDCLITIVGAENTRSLSGIDPSKQQVYSKSYGRLMETFMRRSAANELRWTLALFPTHAYAQDADMSLSDYEDFVYGACKLDAADPVAEWQALHDYQAKLIDYMVGKDRVVVKGPNVDLTLSVKDRVFINADGRSNMPSGEIFTGPVETSVNGWIRYTFPAIYRGREVDGVELKFEDGKVVSATAEKGEAYLNEVLNTDEGARYLGEFAIGTNKDIQQFTGQILFDEKIGGTIHLAVGASYPETGGVNKSNVHWDMICDMKDGGKIWVDDELFYDSGRFVALGE